MYIICIPVQISKTLRMVLVCNSFVYSFLFIYVSCIHQVCLASIALFEENTTKKRKIVGQIIQGESKNSGEFNSNWIKKRGWESFPTEQAEVQVALGHRKTI